MNIDEYCVRINAYGRKMMEVGCSLATQHKTPTRRYRLTKKQEWKKKKEGKNYITTKKKYRRGNTLEI